MQFINRAALFWRHSFPSAMEAPKEHFLDPQNLFRVYIVQTDGLPSTPFNWFGGPCWVDMKVCPWMYMCKQIEFCGWVLFRPLSSWHHQSMYGWCYSLHGMFCTIMVNAYFIYWLSVQQKAWTYACMSYNSKRLDMWGWCISHACHARIRYSVRLLVIHKCHRESVSVHCQACMYTCALYNHVTDRSIN